MEKLKKCSISENQGFAVIEKDGKFFSAMEDHDELHFVKDFGTDCNSAFSDYYQRATINGVIPKD